MNNYLITTLCYIEKDGEYLMLLRNKKEHDASRGKWIGVGGKLEEGESPEECVIREAFEETGLTVKPVFRGVVTFVSDEEQNELMFLYTADSFTGELLEECNEGMLSWIPKNRIMELNLWEGDRIFLKRLIEGSTDIMLKLEYEGGALVRYKEE